MSTPEFASISGGKIASLIDSAMRRVAVTVLVPRQQTAKALLNAVVIIGMGAWNRSFGMKRNEKPLSLAALAETFEGLAEKFNSSATLLAKEDSFDSPRHEVDMIYAVQAGTCLLKALDQGFLESGDSPDWDLRAHKQRELWEMRCDIAERRENLKRIRERAAKTSIYSHDRDKVFAELKKLERVPIESQQQMLDELQRNVESFLDPQSENWPLTAIFSWQAFIRLVLIPQDPSRFRMDWREHLPAELFVNFGDKVYHPLKAEQIAKPEKQWKTDDGRICHLVRARADIHATGCKIVAEMLQAEMRHRHLEIGEPRQIGQLQKETGDELAVVPAKTPNDGQPPLVAGDGGGKSDGEAASIPDLNAEATAKSDRPAPAQQDAFDAFVYAREKEGNPKLTPKEAYDFWIDPKRGLAADDQDEFPQLVGYDPGKFSSYKTNLSKARNHPAINQPEYDGKRKGNLTGQKRRNGRKMIGDDG